MNGKIDELIGSPLRHIAGSFLLAVALFCPGLISTNAQPINYQGKLTDKSGNPISGNKEVSLKVYDAKTDGKLTYEEAIGPVTLTKGIYSFNFGEDGKSIATATETVGSTDGEKQIFNYTAANIPIVGDVKITAGDYSWSDTGGASSSSQFTATANKESGQVSAIFISGAPAAGTEITVAYDYNSTGIMEALSASIQSWLEITIGGETLSPRERLVTVPFALKAKTADKLTRGIRVPIYCDHLYLSCYPINGKNITAFVNQLHVTSEIGRSYINDGGNFKQFTHIYIPKGLDRLEVTIDVKGDNIIYKDRGNTNRDITLPTPLAIKLNEKTYPPTSFVSNTSTVIIPEPVSGSYRLMFVASSYYEGYEHRVDANAELRIIGIYK